jgi:hypothetical protein
MTVSVGVMKIENLFQKDKDLARRVEIMELNLRKKGKKKYLITIDPLIRNVCGAGQMMIKAKNYL